MTLRAFIAFMVAATVISAAAATLIIAGTDPSSAPLAVFALLYGSIFFALAGLLALGGIVIRVFVARTDVVARQVAVAFRQALLASGMLTAMLALRGNDLLTWWNIILLIAAGTLLESLFIGGRAVA